MTKPLPFDGWYNGNIDMMIVNGTYADFRDVLEEKVALGKMTQAELERADAQWEEISLEEKMARRGVVVEESTPKPVRVKTTQGEIVLMKAEPSEGNNAKRIREKAKAPPKVKRPAGALTNENNPLAKAKPVVKALQED